MKSEMMKRLFVLTGPSGVGKTTLYKRLLKEFPEINFSISMTTRDRRDGEVDGVDYYFVNQVEFAKLRGDASFAESAFVHGNSYGTLKNEIEEKLAYKSFCLLDIDIQGMIQLKNIYRDANYIFIAPPDMETLKQRLKGRATENPEGYKLRISEAEKELEEKDKFDYIVVNDDFDIAYSKLREIYLNKRGDNSGITN